MNLADISTIRMLLAVAGVLSGIFFMFNRRHPVRTVSEQQNSVEWIYHGATLIADGYEFFPDWSVSMIREFDERIEPALERIYRIAKSVAEHPREKWPEVIREEITAQQGGK